MAPRPKLHEHRRSSSSLLLVALASSASDSIPTSPTSRRPRFSVAVVGGGVIGLSTAIRLAEGAGGDKEQGGGGVVVFARGFGADTTSSGAGGLWEPYKLGDTPGELVNRWSAETLEFLLALAREEEENASSSSSDAAGVIEGPVLQYWTQPAPEDPSWACVAPGFRRMSRAELEAAAEVAARGAEANRRRIAEEEGQGAAGASSLPSFALEAPAIVDGWTFGSAAAQPSRYLSWLARRAERAGVELVTRELASLDELLVLAGGGGGKEGERAGSSSSSSPLLRFDAVVNCAGLAGGDLSRDDATPPTPVRGQVARLRPPAPPPPPQPPLGGAAGLFLDEETYLIQNVDFVVAGGTGQAGDADAAPRAADRASILARTRLLDPELVAARAGSEGTSSSDGQQVEDWAGLRPLRSPVRLEARWVEAASEEGKKRRVLVVSNYGHGGSGFTLHWGCAGDAAALVFEGLRGKKTQKEK